jgi:sulfane dehydrogenase subunit SoxC
MEDTSLYRESLRKGVSVKNREDLELMPVTGNAVSRRTFLTTASASVAGMVVASNALADSLAEVPPRVPGAPMSAHSERSQYVHLARIPESTPGKRPVDPSVAINSKTPLQDLYGNITPTDLHYERSHSGVPNIDPDKHRLLIHGMVRKPLVFTVNDIKSMPSVSRIVFIECSGNGWENWKSADPNLTVQNTHGMLSTNEWTGVPLRFLMDLVGKDPRSTWMLAEGGDAAGVARSIPMTEEFENEIMVAFAQNGEPIRPAHGFPIRLIVPGCEGNLNIKWLRRLKFGDRPFMTRWETDRYTQLQANGKARQFQLYQEVNSVITNPSGTMTIQPGFNLISGLAWSGNGAIERVEVSTDGARTWKRARLNMPVLPKAQTRFEMEWVWDGKPTKIVSRSLDDKGNMQPDRAEFIKKTGTNALFHYHAQQTWAIDESGRVSNVLA